jgi:hypothetical protein
MNNPSLPRDESWGRRFDGSFAAKKREEKTFPEKLV